MSHRKDIRLGAIAALTNGGVEPWPTVAGGRVFDSKADPIMHYAGTDHLPAILVYTNTTIREPLSSFRPPFCTKLELIVEIALGSFDARIQTDAELESALDDFEEQVLSALLGTGQGARSFGRMFSKIIGVESLRVASADVNQRLAMREIVFTLEYVDQCKSLDEAFPRFRELRMRGSVNNSVDEIGAIVRF